MSGGFSVVPNDLVTGSQGVSGHADRFGSIGETFSGATSSGTEFGTLSVSGQVSTLTSRLSALHGQQFGSAHQALKGAATALQTAGQDYAAADYNASFAAHNIVTE